MSNPQYQGGYLNQIPDILNPLGGGPRKRAGRAERVHAVFGLVGLAVGLAAGIYAGLRSGSWWLAAFVFLLTAQFVGRGIGDIVTDPKKVQRFCYFVLQPAISTGVLVLTYRWWGLMWLSALVGFFVGGILWFLVVSALFPRIAKEETADTEARRHPVPH